MYQSDFETNIDTDRAKGKPLSNLVDPIVEFFGISMIFQSWRPCIKALIHGRDLNLLHIKDARETNSDPRKHPDWTGNIMVSPENVF